MFTLALVLYIVYCLLLLNIEDMYGLCICVKCNEVLIIQMIPIVVTLFSHLTNFNQLFHT